MLKKIIFGIILLAVCRTASGQDETIPVSSAEKFNKRGIYNNSDLSFNGQEIISDYDGNLMIKYSTPINLPNDLGSDLTVIYNSNVEHRCFRDGWADGYTINAPEWIIGYKGIALQTFNFETNYQINFDSQDSPQDIPLLIPGYHFDNKLNAQDNLGRDYITILRADGSKIILENIESWKENGLYVEKGQNTYGFAIVDSVDVNSRKIYYKPGDGLTYVFEEETFKKLVTDTTNTVFRIVYLKEIRYFDTYNLDDSLPMLKKVSFVYEFYNDLLPTGRKLIKSIITSTSRSAHEVDFLWSFQSGILYTNIYNNNSNDKLTLLLYPYPTNIFTSTYTDEASRILSVKEIIDKNGRKDSFSYFSNSDNLALRRFDTGTRFAYNFPLLKEYITFSGKKITYDYYRQVFDSLLEEFPTPDNLSLDFTTGNYLIYDNINEAGRDCFTNFMLKKKSVYQKQNSQFEHVLDEEYDYYQTDSLGNRVKKFSLAPKTLQGIVTAITTTNRLGGTAHKNTVVKNFSRYAVDKILLLSPDAGSTVKLMNEKIYNNNSEDYPLLNETSYNYDIGDYVPNQDMPSQSFWSGTFTELEERITKYAADSSSYTTKRYRNASDIQYDSLKFFSPNYSPPIFIKKIIRTEKWYDPKSLITEKNYKNYLANETSSSIYPTTDKTYFHKIHLPEIERVYSSDGLIKSHTQYSYIPKEDPDSKGKLELIISNVHSLPDTVKYFYSTNHYRYAYGLPYYKKTTKGVIEEYDHADVALSKSENTAIATAIGFLVDELGNKTTEFFSHTGFSLTPFSTTIKFSDGTAFGSFITANNKKEKPDFEVDLNGYYSKFEYDNLGRLKKAVLPGNYQKEFDSDSLYEYNPITITYNDNASGEYPINIVEKKWLSGSKTLDTQIDFDSFGRLCKTSVRNDAGTLEEKSLKEFDYLGRVVKETQGGSYTHYNNYNIVGDLLNVTNADGSIKTNTYHYGQGTIGDQTYYVQITAKDETGKTKTSYYDQVGNLVAEQLGSNNPTLFYYDGIYRLTKVKTPEGIETTYQYDQNSNVIYKHSPDFGTYRYAYDRFNRLRFQLHVESQEFVFNNYDPLDRLLYTGVINNYTESSFNSLNADIKNSFEEDQNNFVVVNQYDSFVQSGVFVDQDLQQSFAFENPKGRLTASAYRDKPGQTWNYKLYSYDHLGRIKDQFLVE